MAKLFFRYSAMDAGKTLDLLKVAYNYNDRGHKTLILTSNIDSRAGDNKVKSRVGLDHAAITTAAKDNLFELIKLHVEQTSIACILVDEIHFFTTEQIDQLSDVVDYLKIPVICYGLRSDYCGRPFPGSSYLLAITDSIEELRTICHCGTKATYNMLVHNETAVKSGDAVFIADDDKLKNQGSYYMSVCRLHFKQGNFG